MMISIVKNILIQAVKANKYSLLFLYMIYYLVRHPSKPFLQYHSSKEIYIRKMKSLHQKYKTIFVTNFGILQSFLQLHRLVDPIERKSYRLKVPYNGEIVLDVCENDINNDNKNDVIFIDEISKKNVLLVHGFNGSSNSKYIIGLCHHLKKAGYRIFCFNARGTKEVLNNSIFFHIGWTVDLKVAVEFILHNYKGPMEIYGFSMGGSWVTKYLGEETNLSPRIIKGGAICLPFDFYKIEDWMSNEKWVYRKRLLNRLLAYNFCKYIRRNKETFKNAVDLESIYRSRSLRDIDNILTKKVFNIKCITNYYKQESCVHYLKNIMLKRL